MKNKVSTELGHYERFRRAERLFTRRDYVTAARVLEELIQEVGAEPATPRHGLAAARELLARAYYHSAQLRRAEALTRSLLEEDPCNGYAALLLARTLQRRSRHDEADRANDYAVALGAPGVFHAVTVDPVGKDTV